MKDGKHVILYVDDDSDYLDAMRVLLESKGYLMVAADSAEDGVRVFKREQPDLVLIDLMMEEVDAGTSFIKEIRSQGANVPIIMISSAGDHLSMTTDYTELGLAGLFQKPVDPETLLMVLASKLRKAAKPERPGG